MTPESEEIVRLRQENYNLRANLETAIAWLIELVGPECFEEAMKNEVP